VRLRLPIDLSEALEVSTRVWRERNATSRLWARDATLWTGGDESSWLGWLDAPGVARTELSQWSETAERSRSFEDAVLLGMGGSSLCAEVQLRLFGPVEGHPRLQVLDSTSPDQISSVEATIDPARTLFVVASKSGTTLEPNLLLDYFESVVARAVGRERAPGRFLAVTDPGSALERRARDSGFVGVVHGEPSIGGRYSALSPFGLVPASIQGLDVAAWLDAAAKMVERCREVDPSANPGVGLGLALGISAQQGRDKLTLVAAPGLAALGAWIEQLVAESTGKQGLGILPFDGECLGPPAVYGSDRLFVALRLGGRLGDGDDERLSALAAAGHPVVELDVTGVLDAAGELFRWEFATAVAGAVLGIHPFDQPDVESAKVAARELTKRVEQTGSLPDETPIFEAADGTRLFAERSQARVLRSAAGPDPRLEDLLRAHFARLGRGDYFALLPFLARDERRTRPLERIRQRVRDHRQVASALGFGPRFLHSTGQAYKGGPASGVFLQVTAEPERDLAIPGQKLSFGQVLAVQAGGDLSVLESRGRRCLRVHLPVASAAALERLADAVDGALGD